MKFQTILFSSILMLMSAQSFSECGTGYCRGIGTEVAQTATITDAGVLFMVPSGANLGCSLIEGIYMKLDISHPSFKEIYSTYLAAIATKQYFQIGVDGSSVCTVSYIRTWN